MNQRHFARTELTVERFLHQHVGEAPASTASTSIAMRPRISRGVADGVAAAVARAAAAACCGGLR